MSSPYVGKKLTLCGQGNLLCSHSLLKVDTTRSILPSPADINVCGCWPPDGDFQECSRSHLVSLSSPDKSGLFLQAALEPLLTTCNTLQPSYPSEVDMLYSAVQVLLKTHSSKSPLTYHLGSCQYVPTKDTNSDKTIRLCYRRRHIGRTSGAETSFPSFLTMTGLLHRCNPHFGQAAQCSSSPSIERKSQGDIMRASDC